MTEIPADVLEKVRAIFAQCNLRTTECISMNPNTQEEWLDHIWISEAVQFSTPQILSSGWIVKVEAHFLGGMRHLDRWEIADIGMLVHLRLGPEERRSKVVLLQSKRLYPTAGTVREESASDYFTGFARLADEEDESLSIAFATEYEFTTESCYKALRRGDSQTDRISQYEEKHGLRVYYQFYNPRDIPFTQVVPLAGYTPNEGDPGVGVRIVPAPIVRTALKDSTVETLRVSDLQDLDGLPSGGWRLEDFVADEVLACREGTPYGSIRDEPMQALFNRRAGPIAAAIAITIEAPDAVSST